MKYERDERRKLRGELYSQLGSPETSFRRQVGRILSKAPGQSRIANVVVGPKPVRLSFPGIAQERYDDETTAAASGNSANKHGVQEEFICLQ